MRANCVLVVFTLFFFLSVFGSCLRSAFADENETGAAYSQYQWVLWKVAGSPQNPVALAKGVFRSKKSCMADIPEDTSVITGEMRTPLKKGYACLLKGMVPVFPPSHRYEPDSPVPSKQPSISDNGHN